MIKRIFWLLLSAALIHACTQPGSIGTDFIQDEVINLKEIDTITMNTKTVNPGPIVLFDSMPALTRYLAGQLNDPIFGNSSSQIFGQLRMSNPGGTFFENATLDSVVMSLVYDSTSVYGNYEEERVDVEVYRLIEDMQLNARYESDQTFATADIPLGQKLDFLPEITRERTILVETSPGEIDTQTVAPQVRVRLDDALGMEIMNYDSTRLQDSDNLIELFKGVNVRVNSENSMLSFAFIASNLTIYYKQDDTLSRQFTLSITNRSPALPSYTHDFSTGIVSDFIEDEQAGDSLLFAQGMAGVAFEVEFPYLSAFQDDLVNYAELSFTVAELPEDDPSNFPPVNQITGVFTNENGTNSLVLDAFLAELENGNSVFLQEAVGGFIQEETVDGQTLKHYKLIVTNHFSQMLKQIVPPRIRIRPRIKNVNADRVVIYGPGHSEYPMEFKLLLSTQ